MPSEQGREVMAVPGPVTSEQSRGCHRLIQQGAKLVQTVEDVLDELSPMYRDALARSEPGLASTDPVDAGGRALGLKPGRERRSGPFRRSAAGPRRPACRACYIRNRAAPDGAVRSGAARVY